MILSPEEMRYFGLTILEWCGIATALFTGASVVMLYYIRKANKMSTPRISKYEPQTKQTRASIVVSNPSQIGIGITDIYFRKTYRFKHIKCNWQQPSTTTKDELYPMVPFVSTETHYVFSGSKKCYLTEPDIDSKATYKIVVKTTGGCCSTKYCPASHKAQKEIDKTVPSD